MLELLLSGVFTLHMYIQWKDIQPYKEGNPVACYKRMNLGDMMLSEISQAQKNKYK